MLPTFVSYFNLHVVRSVPKGERLHIDHATMCMDIESIPMSRLGTQ